MSSSPVRSISVPLALGLLPVIFHTVLQKQPGFSEMLIAKSHHVCLGHRELGKVCY